MAGTVNSERTTRDALVFIRPIMFAFCILTYLLFEPAGSALLISITFAVAAIYALTRYLIDVRRISAAQRIWPLWLMCDLLLTTAFIYATGGVASRFLIVLIGFVIMYSLEFGLKVGMISALAASSTLLFVSMTSLIVAPRIIIFCSFLLLLAWFTGSLSDDERALRKKLATLAATDDLTGLYNQRHLYHYLGSETAHAERSGTTLSLLALDIDFFKYVNDKHGHLAGDDVLRQIADIMKATVRSQDTIFRFGGEEFIIILPGADTNSAVTIGERIRTAITSHEFVLSSGESLRGITLSAGVVTYPLHASSPRELLQWADSALYDAKKHGKDQIKVLPFMVQEHSPHTEYQA